MSELGLGKISGIGIVAAFGLMTMSSSFVNSSSTVIDLRPTQYFDASGFFQDTVTVCNSSLLSNQAIGDIVLLDKNSDFVQAHSKKAIKLQISKIRKHISHFDFEDTYEEI